MANLYGLTKTDPVNAPIGIVGSPGVAIILKEGFTVPSLKNGTIGGSLTVSGALNVSGITTLSNTLNNTTNITNLSTLNTSGVATFSGTVVVSGKVNSTVLPNITNTYNLGSTSFKWANGYFTTIETTSVNATNLTASSLITAGTGLNVTGTTALTGNLTCTGTLQPKDIKFNDTSYAYNAQNTVMNFFAEGSFTGVLTGCTTSPPATFRYVRIGDSVIFSGASTLEGTSNATTMTITGLPAWLTPSTTKIIPHIVKDNGTLTIGKLVIETTGVLTFYKDANGGVFTASGIKGIPGLSGCYSIQ